MAPICSVLHAPVLAVLAPLVAIGVQPPASPIAAELLDQFRRTTATEADLVSISKFLRESPTKVGGTDRDRVEGSWPVTRVTLQPDVA